DSSGKGRNLSQPNEKAQPALIKFGGIGVVRFDGIDDNLRAIQQNAKLNSFTSVIAADPLRNLGDFTPFMALNAANQRDYASGLTIDLGPQPTPQFSALNVE